MKTVSEIAASINSKPKFVLKYGTRFLNKRDPSKGVISCFTDLPFRILRFSTKDEAQQYADSFNQTWGKHLQSKVYVEEGYY